MVAEYSYKKRSLSTNRSIQDIMSANSSNVEARLERALVFVHQAATEHTFPLLLETALTSLSRALCLISQVSKNTYDIVSNVE